MQSLIHFLAHKAYKLRVDSVKEATQAGSGHPTSCLSAADIVAALFFHIMRFDPHNFECPTADRFILSKGHASALLYAVWKELGLLTEKELMTYRQFGSPLEGHPTFRFAYTEAATGSLGIGLSIGVGEALAASIDGYKPNIFVLLGDGELAEGCVWEAAELASYYKLHNLIAIVDCNRLGQSQETMAGTHCAVYAERFSAFGFDAVVVDGHDIKKVVHLFDKMLAKPHKPIAIIARTIKGYGIDTIENKEGYHGKAISQAELPAILAQMHKRFADVADDAGSYTWSIQLPQQTEKQVQAKTSMKPSIAIEQPKYIKTTKVSTRKAFGTVLAELGTVYDQIVVLDGDVKNSTYTQDFEKVYPERFVQSFIAEQNMVSMAVGMARRGKIPFVATFGAFFCRAHDQIRMAAIGQSPLRLVGSHAGVSIGQDGPSQMALEDISLMRALPGSIVLYPSDAVTAHALTIAMATYHNGISYLRTTRMDTPIIYNNDEQFVIGGSKVVHMYDNAAVCIIAAGITLHEACKAHDQLIARNIYVSVVDAYSIKPLDVYTIKQIAAQSHNRIITVEDHYPEGGIGEAVRTALSDSSIQISSLAVRQLPRSGSPEELLAWAEIDADAIIKAVHALILPERL